MELSSASIRGRELDSSSGLQLDDDPYEQASTQSAENRRDAVKRRHRDCGR
jgi:hypothetical protein